MCGIAGIVCNPASRVTPEQLNTLLLCLEHRGPDDQGYLLFSQGQPELGRERLQQEQMVRVLLLHRRLSILDLTETGWQPMATPDGRYYIVFNGEIYNYLELRKELETEGRQFRSHSDTEVLLAAYARWGKSVLTRLAGMFAFAILDTREQTLFLARDFFGIKPLYYTSNQQGLAFASEIRALLEFGWVDRRVNPGRLYDYLRYGVTDHSSETMLADVLALPPAHYLEVSLDDPGYPEPVRYWDIDLSQRLDLSFDEAAEQLRTLFLENIRLHLRSDVAVGAALSGGIDSSSVVMAMRHVQGEGLDLHTFTYVADDERVSEAKYADVVGQASRAFAHYVEPTPDELVADLENLIAAQGEPFGNTTIYAQYRVFRLAREAGIKVMLDGQGADELLGGYRHYLGARLASLIRQGHWTEAINFLNKTARLPGSSPFWVGVGGAAFLLPTQIQEPMRRLVGKEMAPAWLNVNWFRAHGVIPKPLNYTVRDRETLRRSLYESLTSVALPSLLRYEDRNSMAFSIESRVPFLTPSLADFVYALPESYIIAPDGTSKSVFRAAMKGIVPEIILNRQDKIGFATPERAWLGQLGPWVKSVLAGDTASRIPALNLPEVKREWTRISQGWQPFDFRVWRWCNLIEWARQLKVVLN